MGDRSVWRCRPTRIVAYLVAPFWFAMSGVVARCVADLLSSSPAPGVLEASFWFAGLLGLVLLVILQRAIERQSTWVFDGESLSSPSLPEPLRIGDVIAVQVGISPGRGGSTGRLVDEQLEILFASCIILFFRNGTCLPLQVLLARGGHDLMQAVLGKCFALRNDSIIWDDSAVRDRVGGVTWNVVCHVRESQILS